LTSVPDNSLPTDVCVCVCVCVWRVGIHQVYAMEKLVADGKIFCKTGFACTQCSKKLGYVACSLPVLRHLLHLLSRPVACVSRCRVGVLQVGYVCCDGRQALLQTMLQENVQGKSNAPGLPVDLLFTHRSYNSRAYRWHFGSKSSREITMKDSERSSTK
jgi:hypothetical protein